MERKHKLLGYYNYTVVLTYVGMLVGFAGILYVLWGRIAAAVVCLMVSGFCDMFDGTVAATRPRTEPEKEFGIQIDSLSDLVCFGVLPAAITSAWGMRALPVLEDSAHAAPARAVPVLAVSGLYLLCALIRLAYFNVDEIERQKHSAESRKIYYGLPVTLSALFLPIVYALSLLLGWMPAIPLTVILGVMAVCFLLPVPLRKPGLAGKLVAVACGAGAIALMVVALMR